MRAHATQIALHVAGAECALALSNFVAQPLLDVEEFVAADGGPAGSDLFAEVLV
jgi:N-acetyl-1-D-myo-inositol-2-amino-2-deoxy-alpha-D-glucopyranoside deacetylase